MKTLLSGLAFFFIQGKAISQQVISALQPQKGSSAALLPDTTSQSIFSRLNNRPPDTAYYSHASPAGDVYTLPQDKMPCLSPGRKYIYNQPNAGKTQPKTLVIPALPPDNNIPNAYTGNRIVLEPIPQKLPEARKDQ